MSAFAKLTATDVPVRKTNATQIISDLFSDRPVYSDAPKFQKNTGTAPRSPATGSGTGVFEESGLPQPCTGRRHRPVTPPPRKNRGYVALKRSVIPCRLPGTLGAEPKQAHGYSRSRKICRFAPDFPASVEFSLRNIIRIPPATLALLARTSFPLD